MFEAGRGGDGESGEVINLMQIGGGQQVMLEVKVAEISRQELRSMSLQIMSFGFKHGTPTDADFVFDLRCLPNPHWEKKLRPYSGKDQPIIDFLSKQESVDKMLQDLVNFFYYWIPRFEEENRSYLSIALGCTGGHHRSVYLAEQLAAKLRELNKQVIIRHRDV